MEYAKQAGLIGICNQPHYRYNILILICSNFSNLLLPILSFNYRHQLNLIALLISLFIQYVGKYNVCYLFETIVLFFKIKYTMCSVDGNRPKIRLVFFLLICPFHSLRKPKNVISYLTGKYHDGAFSLADCILLEHVSVCNCICICFV